MDSHERDIKDIKKLFRAVTTCLGKYMELNAERPGCYEKNYALIPLDHLIAMLESHKDDEVATVIDIPSLLEFCRALDKLDLPSLVSPSEPKPRPSKAEMARMQKALEDSTDHTDIAGPYFF